MANVTVYTSNSPALQAELDRRPGRYAFGACNSGLPLNADGASCSGDCHPVAD